METRLWCGREKQRFTSSTSATRRIQSSSQLVTRITHNKHQQTGCFMIFMPFLLRLGVVYYWLISCFFNWCFVCLTYLYMWLFIFRPNSRTFNVNLSWNSRKMDFYGPRGQSFILAWCFVNFRVATIKHPHHNSTGLRNPHSSPTPNFQFLESLIKSWKGLRSIRDLRVTKIHPQIPQQFFINLYPTVSNTNNVPQQFLSNSFPVFSFSAAKRVHDSLVNFHSFFRKDLRQKEQLNYSLLTFIFMFHLFFIVPSIFPYDLIYI